MLKTGGKAGADAGSARAEGAARGTPGEGPQHTTAPAPGAVRRQPADEGPKINNCTRWRAYNKHKQRKRIK